MSPDIYRWTFQCQPQDERFDRIDSDCEACILAAVGGDVRILQELRASMLGRKKKRGVFPRLLPLVESWIGWTGAQAEVRKQSDLLAREIRNCRKQMQEARRQKRRNEEEGILDPPPLQMSSTSSSKSRTPFSDSVYDHDRFQDNSYEYEIREEVKNPFADPKHDRGRLQNKVYQYEDPDEHEHDNKPEGSIIDFYATRLSSANLVNNNKTTQAQNEAKIHPAFKDSMVFQFQTNASAFTLPAQNPFQDQVDDQEPGNLPPRPSNPTAYDDPEPGLNGDGPMHRGASARVRQPPPAAYNNRANAKQVKNSWKRATGYTESVYSRDEDDDRPLHPPSPQKNGGNSAQAAKIEEEEEYVPPRRHWKKDAEGRTNGVDGKESRGKRDTKITNFGDFI